MLCSALGARDFLLDRGVLPGTAQSVCHQERDEPKDGGPGLAEFVEAGAHQPQSGDDIAALDDEHSLKAAAIGAPKGQYMPCRMVEQHCAAVFRCSQITGQQSERTRRMSESHT